MTSEITIHGNQNYSNFILQSNNATINNKNKELNNPIIETSNNLVGEELYIKWIEDEFNSLGKDLFDISGILPYPIATLNTPYGKINSGLIVIKMFSNVFDRLPTIQELNTYGDLTSETSSETQEVSYIYTPKKPLSQIYSEVIMSKLENKDMSGQYVVITGGSRGIGFDMAVIYAQRGAEVLVCSRTADWFEWSKETATLPNSKATEIWGHPNLDMSASYTHDISHARAEWNNNLDSSIPDASFTVITESALSYNQPSQTIYLLPQKYLPYYYSQIGVSNEVFNKITHVVADLRDPSQVRNFITNKISKIPDLLFINHQTEGTTINGISSETIFEKWENCFGGTTSELINNTPNIRYNILGKSTPIPEYNIGYCYLLDRLKKRFNENTKNIKIILTSSIAILLNQVKLISNIPEVEVSAIFGEPASNFSNFPISSSYALNYAKVKTEMVNMCLYLRLRHELNIHVMAPGPYQGMVNWNWVPILNEKSIPALTSIYTPSNQQFAPIESWDLVPQKIEKYNSVYKAGRNSAYYQWLHSGAFLNGDWTDPTLLCAMLAIDYLDKTKLTNINDLPPCFVTEPIGGAGLVVGTTSSELFNVNFMSLGSPFRDMTKENNNVLTSLINVIDQFNNLFYSKYNKGNILESTKCVIARLNNN